MVRGLARSNSQVRPCEVGLLLLPVHRLCSKSASFSAGWLNVWALDGKPTACSCFLRPHLLVPSSKCPDFCFLPVAVPTAAGAGTPGFPGCC
jgi:hypothetical protein